MTIFHNGTRWRHYVDDRWYCSHEHVPLDAGVPEIVVRKFLWFKWSKTTGLKHSTCKECTKNISFKNAWPHDGQWLTHDVCGRLCIRPARPVEA